jgi:glyoxylase I family protein
MEPASNWTPWLRSSRQPLSEGALIMAQVDHLLAVIAVSDIDVGRAWYTTLFGRDPDNNPMPHLVEWRVTENGWVQVTEDGLRAGHGMLNRALSDIEEGARELREKGIDAVEIVDANKGYA